jgi:hypothetical protein
VALCKTTPADYSINLFFVLEQDQQTFVSFLPITENVSSIKVRNFYIFTIGDILIYTVVLVLRDKRVQGVQRELYKAETSTAYYAEKMTILRKKSHTIN